MKVLLIVIVVTGGWGHRSQTTLVEFDSMESCKVAAREVVRNNPSRMTTNISATCVLK